MLNPTSSQEQGLRIGEVAAQAGVNTSLIRYYERIGLLPPPDRVSGRRRYDQTVLRRLAVIDVAQRAGLSLDEISGLLEIGTDPISARLQQLAQRKLPEVEALIARAEQVREWLTAATGCECVSVDECALFDAAAAPRSLRRAREGREHAAPACDHSSSTSRVDMPKSRAARPVPSIGL